MIEVGEYGDVREQNPRIIHRLEQQKDQRQEVQNTCSGYDPPYHWVRPEKSVNFQAKHEMKNLFASFQGKEVTMAGNTKPFDDQSVRPSYSIIKPKIAILCLK